MDFLSSFKKFEKSKITNVLKLKGGGGSKGNDVKIESTCTNVLNGVTSRSADFSDGSVVVIGDNNA